MSHFTKVSFEKLWLQARYSKTTDDTIL